METPGQFSAEINSGHHYFVSTHIIFLKIGEDAFGGGGVLKGFISYSHSDEAVFEGLKRQLVSLADERLVRFWTDRQLRAGENWEARVIRELIQADIALFLVSPDFLQHDRFARSRELAVAKRLWKSKTVNGGIRIVPVLARQCRYEPAFGQAAGLQPAPGVNRWIETFPDLPNWLSAVEDSLAIALQSEAGSYGRHAHLMTADLERSLEEAHDSSQRASAGIQSLPPLVVSSVASALEAVDSALCANPYDLRTDILVVSGILKRMLTEHPSAGELIAPVLRSVDQVELMAAIAGCPAPELSSEDSGFAVEREPLKQFLEESVQRADELEDYFLSMRNRGNLDANPMPSIVSVAASEVSGKRVILKALSQEKRFHIRSFRAIAVSLAVIAVGVAHAARAEGVDSTGVLAHQTSNAEALATSLPAALERVMSQSPTRSVSPAAPITNEQVVQAQPGVAPTATGDSRAALKDVQFEDVRPSLLDRLLGSFTTDMAMCLGTASTQVYVRGKGVKLDEPSVVAYMTQGGRKVIHAVGEQAKSMLGKTPVNMEAMRPMRDGVIADFEAAEELIRYFIGKVFVPRMFRSSRLIICVPSSATSFERHAISQSALAAGVNHVELIEEPMAAAIGAGLTIGDPSGSIFVHLGAGTSEVAVFALGGIVYSRSVRVGGDKMDQAIVNYLRRKHSTLIGESSAEKINKEIGTAIPPKNGTGMTVNVRGRGTLDGAPKEIEVTEAMIAEALLEPVTEIIDAVDIALAAMPPELSQECRTNNVLLSGKAAQLRGLPSAISKHTGLKVILAPDPARSTILGAGLVAENIRKYRSVLLDPDLRPSRPSFISRV